MHKFITILVMSLLVCFSLIITDANAKRFGGGRSFGASRPANSYTHNFSRANPINKSSLGSKLLGPIAGLITGGLIASLLMGNGLASGIFTWVIVAIVGLLLVKLLVMRRGNTFNPQLFNARPENNASHNQSYSSPQQNPIPAYAGGASYPLGFEPDTFLRDAKKQFIRLQAAYDQKNIADLRRFTSPEVFAEIQIQLQEREDRPNQTDVISLDAVLLDMNQENSNLHNNDQLASVRFSGSIREDGNIEPLNEIWHFRKDPPHHEWVVAGIEQQ